MAPPENGKSSAGDFIFVNHSAKRLRPIKDRSHRAIINQHVQKVWIKNKKPKDQKVTQRPEALDATQRTIDDLTPESEADPSNGAYPTPPHQSPPYKTSSLIKFRAINPRRPRRQKNEQIVPCAPLNMLTHGNTDPFNTLAVPLDSTVSHLLQYSKDVMFPTVYSMELRSTTPSLGITKAWEYVQESFEDECAMSAYLAISATSVMRVAPSSDFGRVALQFNNRSSALLRQRLADSGNSIDPRLYIVVLWLSSNALATGDFTAGMIHANTLCFLVRRAGGINNVEPFQREHILEFDVQFAIMFLRRPFFAAADYAPGPFNMLWLNDRDAVDNPSPNHKLITYPPLTPAVLASPDLASAISDLRELHAVYIFTLHNPLPGTSPIFRWMYLQKHAVEARLLDICCSLIYSPIEPPSSSTNSNASPPSSTSLPSPTQPDPKSESTLLHPTLCIATLYWTAMAVGFSLQKIHACSVLLSHLRNFLFSHLRSILAPVTARHPPQAQSPLLLWILYVGTIAERALGLSQAPGPWYDWCTRRFILQIRSMGIHGHRECRRVLEGILFAERMHGKHEGSWVDEKGGLMVQGEEDGNGDEERDGIRVGVGVGTGTGTAFERWFRRVEREFGGVVAGEDWG
jgi:hypothetical protein